MLMVGSTACGLQLPFTRVFPEPEVVLRLPGESLSAFSVAPDGALFVAGRKGIHYRRDRTSAWTRLEPPDSPYPVWHLYAVSADELFALYGGCTDVYRWTSASGWSRMRTPFTDSTWRDSSEHGEQCHLAQDMWGLSGNRVFVSTSHGGLLVYDGSTWSAEKLPLRTTPSLTRWNYGIRSVTADSTRIVALTDDALLVHRDGAWRLAREGLHKAPDDCGILNAIAAVKDAIAVAGVRPCLLLVRDSGVVSLTDQLQGTRSTIMGGHTQPDGTALFWTRSGRVILVDGHFKVSVYYLGGVSPFRGAGLFNGYIYGAAGAGDSIAEVLRVPLRRR